MLQRYITALIAFFAFLQFIAAQVHSTGGNEKKANKKNTKQTPPVSAKKNSQQSILSSYHSIQARQKYSLGLC